MLPDRIETQRLILRRPTMADARSIFENYASNPRVTRYLCWPTHRSLADAERFLQMLEESMRRGEQFTWLIEHRAQRKVGGSIGVVLQGNRAALGYCLAEELWGQGNTTEAAQAVVPLVWSLPGVERLEAVCHVEHLRSARVLEKIGLRYIGIDRHHSVLPALGRHRQDMLRYGVSRPAGI
ncbi:GNAT family N-acetyltransferase [Aeoliella sp. ICT_H6.2]|uniref:GNAT family N-acetyltransferase n=1 Tax=Aeoliella straminimaris TaxID=2954799 RepID=A0A9X2JFH7_9BACT|nr:GNAT family N-acetyltransferase [Aeoliella straminimaris]MCO6042463.1 GNAT family N-acetyltransferase [Aeoliella straminimaris]